MGRRRYCRFIYIIILLAAVGALWNFYGLQRLRAFLMKQQAAISLFQNPKEKNSENASKEANPRDSANLLDSPICMIPDLDPLHPSVAHLVKQWKPANCARLVPRLTYTRDNWLHFDFKAFLDFYHKPFNFTCCYRGLSKKTPNKFKFDRCILFKDVVKIKSEFLKVECKSEKKIFYRNYHTSIPEIKSSILPPHSKYSVMILGIDSVSRLNMLRQLPRTYAYLKNEMGAFEMFGLNKVADNTFPNLVPMLTGLSQEQLRNNCWKNDDQFLDSCPFIWKDFESVGYKTIFIEDSPDISTFEYLKKGFASKPTNYYFMEYFRNGLNKIGSHQQGNSQVCFGPQTQVEVLLNILQEFVRMMEFKPYFALSWTNSLSHDFLNSISSADHIYEEFLRSLHKKGYLYNTIVMLVSDHGMRFGDIVHTFVGFLEQRLPMLMVYLPPRLKWHNPSATASVAENSRRLITPFDLYVTMRHVLSSKIRLYPVPKNYSGIGKSLFNPISQNRTCSAAGINEHWCACQNSSSQPKATVDEIVFVTKFVITHINNLLSEYKDCSQLNLKKVQRFFKKSDDLYVVTFKTKPSNAIFETTVKKRGKMFQIVGQIGRLDEYGDQGECVQNYNIRMYCFCKNNVERAKKKKMKKEIQDNG